MQHDLIQISTYFPKDVFEIGTTIANSKNVYELNSKNQGAVISAKVKDGGESHRVFVNVSPTPRGQPATNHPGLFESECSCELGESCEHVVAALLASIQPELINHESATKQPAPEGQWMNKIRANQKQSAFQPSLSTYFALKLSTNSNPLNGNPPGHHPSPNNQYPDNRLPNNQSPNNQSPNKPSANNQQETDFKGFGPSRLSLEVFVAKSRTLDSRSNTLALSDKKPIFLDQHITAHPPRYILPIDLKILTVLIKKSKKFELPNPVDISSFVEFSFLQLLLQSGRCSLSITEDTNEQPPSGRTPHWMNAKETQEEIQFTPLLNGPPKHLQPTWHVNHRGDQWLSLNRPKQGINVFGSEAPFYVDVVKNEWGLVGSPLSKQALSLILEGVVLNPKQITTFIKSTKSSLSSNSLANNSITSTPVSRKKANAQASSTNRIYESYKDNQLPLPIKLRLDEHKDVRPRPILKLYSKRISTVVDHSYRRPALIDGAALHFEYGMDSSSLSFHHKEKLHSKTVFSKDCLHTIHRLYDEELAALDQLQEIAPGLVPLNQLHDVDWTEEFNLSEKNRWDLGFTNEDEWQNFLLLTVVTLKEKGWQVEVEPRFRHHFSKAESWYGDIQQSNNKWFDLEMGIVVDGEKINLLPILIQYINEGNPLLSIDYLNEQAADSILNIPLNDGRIIPLKAGRVKRILSVFVELYKTPKVDAQGKLQLAYNQISRVGELDFNEDQDQNDIENGIQWHGRRDLFEKAQQLRLLTEIEQIPTPTALDATLRDYQQTGLNWLQFLRQYELGGILADDMGLGKTIQTLALILHEKQHDRLTRPALVIAPTSVISNWRREAHRFAPSLQVVLFHGSKRHQNPESPFELALPKRKTKKQGNIESRRPTPDIIITSYALIHRDLESWQSYELSYVILDEAHHIKNRKTKVATSVRKLKTQHKLCLTGTPMENHLGELWSIFDFLMPKFLGTEREFKKQYRNPIEKDNNQERAEALSHRLSPFLLRRTKAQVATELPAKTEIIQSVSFNEAQQDLYESIRLSMHQKVRSEITKKGMNKSQLVILDALLKLRQVCCDPSLVKMDEHQNQDKIESAKLELLMELIPEMVEEGRRILVFSQFTSMLAIIEKRLQKSNIDYAKLTGSTRNRDEQIDLFQSLKVPVFLLSLKAGGVGLNLTAADTVIHYDPWWNPAAENQATDRAHRIGQDKPVFVYKLLVENTVEESIFQMQKDKLDLVQSMYRDADPSEYDAEKPFRLSGEELADLLIQ
ncbi:MAG: DEAD/DEAH box helicase [Pseudomonadales bacterium]|nr:DEAD/DEAH box helicase [Pseudomonadales bacterium]